MTRKQAIKEIRKIAKLYNVKLKFSSTLCRWGQANLEKEYVQVSSRLTIDKMMATACHEICHILNKREGRYPIYHDPKNWKSYDYPSAFKATAHRAEVYTDKRGKALMKIHFPGFKFSTTYKNTKKSKEFLRDAIGLDYLEYWAD